MQQNFPVVGLGASAGGLDAFKKFLRTISNDSGMAYVLVQHLAPEHESLLPEILSKSTDLPVHEITDDINLAPNRVYIIPENKILTTLDGVLKLAPRDLSSKRNMPIDIFFKSLAEVHKSFAIGTVLSGTGFDGTEGLKMIKEMGGITYAQALETATFDGMPQNAVNSGAVDFILPPEDIAPHLVHIKRAYKTNYAYSDNSDLSQEDADVFKHILRILKLRTGHDFTHYKQPTIRRRIARRMVTTKLDEPEKYLAFLRSDKEEQDALFNDILIPVSYFFREPAIFNALCDKVFPQMFDNKPLGDSIRFWVAGCSTGEEAYSLAICLHEYMADKFPERRVQIFASDISEKVIAQARAATYNKQELLNVSETRLQNYFTKSDGQFHVSKVIRDMCIFAVHSFLKDPPFSRMDMISCRNVLIYMDTPLQKKALTTFHYALKENGILFLGKSETASGATNLFEPLLKNYKIYSSKNMPRQYTPAAFESPDIVSTTTYAQLPSTKNSTDFQKLAYDILFKKYTPAGVIINQQLDIVHFHGDTGSYLVSSPGKPTFNIINMAREGLAFEIRNAMLKVKSGLEIAISKDILLKDRDYLVCFEIVPLSGNEEPHYLILFHKKPIPSENKITATGRKSADKERISHLEAELQQLRNDYRNVTEIQEISNEELQSANEELLSNGEELQSLNEELETSSEELQSNNEELTTVNDELMDRQDQLVAARNYAEAIVETIREPLIILDKNLRIKTANSSFYKYFNTTEKETEGRLFFDLTHNHWKNQDLKSRLESMLPSHKKMENFEITGSIELGKEQTFMLNARQIQNGRSGEELFLLAFDDITENKVSKLLRESDERFSDLANISPVMMWISGTDMKSTFVNKSWLDFTGNTLEQELEDNCASGIHMEDFDRVAEAFKVAFEKKGNYTIEYRHRRNDGEYRWISCKGIPRFTKDGEFLGFITGCMDIQEQKDFSAALEDKVILHTKELKDSESFLQSILNTTQNLIYVYDFAARKVVFINKKAFETTGYTQQEYQNSTTGDLFTNQIHPDDISVVNKHREGIQEKLDGDMVTIEFRIRNQEGEYKYHLSRDLIFRRDENGNATQYIGVATDISDIRQANENLKSKNQELQHSNIELASFSSIASHDLKEPLRKIQLFSKLVIAAEKEKITAESQHFLERVITSANRMQQLIDDLISYSRTSREKIKFIETDLNLLLEEVMEDLKEMIEQHSATFEIPDMPFIAVLPSQFRQLFMNLISNSFKYAKGNVSPHIVIKSSIATDAEISELRGNPETRYFKFTLTDNGIGFSNEYKDSIFEPFKRLHSKDEYSGTGIGLAIYKKIMLNHKGFITASGEPGKGSVFNIFIPDRRKM